MSEEPRRGGPRRRGSRASERSTCGAAQVPGHRLRPRIRQSHRVHHRAPAGRSGDAGRRVAGTGRPGDRAADDVPEPQSDPTRRGGGRTCRTLRRGRSGSATRGRQAGLEHGIVDRTAETRPGKGERERGVRGAVSGLGRHRGEERAPEDRVPARVPPRHRPHHAIMRAMSDDLVDASSRSPSCTATSCSPRAAGQASTSTSSCSSQTGPAPRIGTCGDGSSRSNGPPRRARGRPVARRGLARDRAAGGSRPQGAKAYGTMSQVEGTRRRAPACA